MATKKSDPKFTNDNVWTRTKQQSDPYYDFNQGMWNAYKGAGAGTTSTTGRTTSSRTGGGTGSASASGSAVTDPNTVAGGSVPPATPYQVNEFSLPGQTADYEALRNAYGTNYTPYQSKTQEELTQQAEDEYASYYDQLRTAAQQAADRNTLAIEQQLGTLGQSYDRQAEESAKQYNQAYSQADRQMLSRGMQRSSYGAQVLANLSEQGARAQRDIQEQRTAAESNLAAQRTQVAQQLSDTLSGYARNQASDVQARARQLETENYDRATASAQYKNQLAADLYDRAVQSDRNAVADSQWVQQMNENQRQFAASQAESQRQFDAQLAENIRQYNETASRKGSSSGGRSSSKTAADTGTDTGAAGGGILGSLPTDDSVGGFGLEGTASNAQTQNKFWEQAFSGRKRATNSTPFNTLKRATK